MCERRGAELWLAAQKPLVQDAVMCCYFCREERASAHALGGLAGLGLGGGALFGVRGQQGRPELAHSRQPQRAVLRGALLAFQRRAFRHSILLGRLDFVAFPLIHFLDVTLEQVD